MSVGRLFLNLSFSDIIWNRLPSVPSIHLVSEDFDDDDGDEEDEEEERLQCLHFSLWDLCFLGEGEDFSGDDNEEPLL